MCTSESVCRVCLASNVRKLYIKDIHLLETYEKLTSAKFNTEDGMPNTVCYICYSRLQRCRTFSDMAHRSEIILRDLLHNGTEVMHETVTALKLEIPQHLTVSTARHVSIDDSDNAGTEHQCSLPSPAGNKHEYNYNCMYDSSPVTVKEEQIFVKEETTKEEIFIEIERCVVKDDVEMDDSFKKEELLTKSNDNTSGEDLTSHCETCSKKFKNQRYLKAHMITHTGEKPFSCDQCNKRFNQLSYYKLHMRIHTEGKPYNCSSCKKTFYRKGNLIKHMQSHLEEKTYVCDRCSKKFKQKSHLKVHMRIHTGEKSFACEICGKTFNQIANLNKHMGIHTGVKPFSCELCGKAFLQRAQVKAHMRSHTGEKPYACNRCEMAFSHASPLRKHMQLHTEVKPFACNRCYMSFTEESILTEHMRIHTAERPFACDKCNKTFTDARNLKRHDMQVHAAERLHACNRCGKTFKRPQHLKKHMTSSYCRAVSADFLSGTMVE